MNATVDTPDATDRSAMADVIDELQRRGIQWPCWSCRLGALASDEPRGTCAHAEFIGAVTYESALQTLGMPAVPIAPGAGINQSGIQE